MSKTSRSKPKKGGLGATSYGKTQERAYSVNLDDDDDDFKPCKVNPFPSKSNNGNRGRETEGEEGMSTEVTGSRSEAVKCKEIESTIQSFSRTRENHFEGIYGGNVEEVGFLLDEVPDMESYQLQEGSQPSCKEEEAEDEVTFLHSTIQEHQTVRNNYGETSTWKNLMERMQKNQQKDSSSTAGTSKKKNKLSAKRALMLSPRTRGFKSKSAGSPVKKNPRLSAPSVPVTSKKLQETVSNDITRKLMESSLEEIDDTLDRKALTEMEINVPTTSKDLPPKKPTKVAPIFLTPEERKALQLSKIAKVPDNNTLDSFVESSSHDYASGTFSENPDHFSGNVVILNNDEITKDSYGGTKTKVCPFYKKLPGVPFCVDAFNYGLISGMEVYFLSHFHSDHYIGLTKKFCKTIICTHSTGNLVRMKLYVEEKYIRKLNINKPYIICDAEVTLIDANHCPGSVMFILRLKNGKVILHTGDFRFTKDMLNNPSVVGLAVDSLYLDTTYCSPEYDFPTQRESVANVIIQLKRRLEYRPKTLILCGSYLIGKERVYFSLAEAIGSKVFANTDKRRIINALENPKFSSLLTSDENGSSIHVVPMFSISAKNLQEYLVKYPQYTNIIGIKPSGWQFSSSSSGCSIKSHYGDTVTIMGVPYSEHSSFSEVKEFVTKLRPKHVQPTVNVGNPKKRGDMMGHIESWLSS